MNHIKKYKIIIATSLLLCLPLGLFLMVKYHQWKKNPSEKTTAQLEKFLIKGLSVIFIQLIIVSFLFYHFGRKFIEVMGTFY